MRMRKKKNETRTPKSADDTKRVSVRKEWSGGKSKEKLTV